MLTEYAVLKTIHVLAVIVWVGGAVTVNVLATRLRRLNEPRRIVAFGRDVEWIGKHFFLPLSVVVLVFGVLTVLSGGIPFSVLWVEIGILGIVITALTGSLFIGPELTRIADMADDRGAEDSEVQRRITRLYGIARIDLVVLLLVAIDMVVKPR